jgi:hypothetical protein
VDRATHSFLQARHHSPVNDRQEPPTPAGAVLPRPRKQLLAEGVTIGQLRGPGWQRTSQGHYVPACVDLDRAEQRIASASVRLPPAGALGGWAAARRLGVLECDGRGIDGRTPLPVPLCCGVREIRRVPGVEVWADPLPAGDVRVVRGVRVTGSTRTCFDGMRRATDLREAVAFADLMLHAGIVSPACLRGYVGAHAGWRGVRQARRAVDLADPMARNRWETRLRLIWLLDAGLPPPQCNPPVFDLQGSLLGYPDLLDPEAGTVAEYDGAGHREPAQHHRDNVREERFEDHGLVVTRATTLDQRGRRALAERLRRAWGRGMRRNRAADRWTLEPPPAWGAMAAEPELRDVLDEMDAGWTPPW